jgi:hypothetical protein
MSTKDYELIAQVIRDQAEMNARALREPAYNGTPSDEYYARFEAKQDALDDLARDLAVKLAQDNPRFRIDTFLKACFGDPNMLYDPEAVSR